MAADPDYLKEIFNQNDSPVGDRLGEIADAGAEDARMEILDKLEQLIWRRKVLEKPYDQLEEIQDMVRSL